MTEILAPDGYAQFLASLKSRIQAGQLCASLAVNRELVLLYWQIGRDILEGQQRESWGTKVIDRLAVDLKRAFPYMKGFSPRNLKLPQVYAGLCGGMARRKLCATGCCTNSLGTQLLVQQVPRVRYSNPQVGTVSTGYAQYAML